MRESDDRRVGLRVLGLVGVLVGLRMLMALPLGRATTESFSEYNQIIAHVQWGYIVGSCVFVWGVATMREGMWRSLTPPYGFVAPVLAMITVLISQYIEVEPFEGGPWMPPETVVQAIRDVLYHDSMFVIAPILLGIGIAVARSERRWVVRGFAVLAVVSLIEGSLVRPPGLVPVYRTLSLALQNGLVALSYGAPSFALGYLLAKPRNTGTTDSLLGLESDDTIRAAGATGIIIGMLAGSDTNQLIHLLAIGVGLAIVVLEVRDRPAWPG